MFHFDHKPFLCLYRANCKRRARSCTREWSKGSLIVLGLGRRRPRPACQITMFLLSVSEYRNFTVAFSYYCMMHTFNGLLEAFGRSKNKCIVDLLSCVYMCGSTSAPAGNARNFPTCAMDSVPKLHMRLQQSKILLTTSLAQKPACSSK